jgi:HAD superfamily hydrolase (TIGR01509 family)
VEKHGVTVKTGAFELLDYLDEKGIKKCVATSTEYESMARKMKAAGLFDRFDGFVTGDQVENGKPHPEIFLKAAAQVGVPPENCLVLEDSSAGIVAAYAAHMRPIMVPDMAKPDIKAKTRAYAICDDLSALINTL